MPDDAELLRRYARDADEAAFAEFVRRHIDFVYGAALRPAGGDAPLAADVVQLVFCDVARKAAALAAHSVLIGWLHTATRFAVAKAIRGDARRRAREREAWQMNEQTREETPGADWTRLQPVLDAALGELKERDRAAILLRFFENRPLAEVGAKLALSETAARSCVDRALEKLRERLARRGITSTGAALGLALANQVTVAAPAGLANAVASGAVASVAAAGGLGVFGTILTMSKIKMGIAGALLLAGVTVSVIEARANRALRAELRPISGRDEEARSAQLQRENQQLALRVKEAAQNNPEIEELTRVRNRIAALKARPPGVVDEEMRAPRNLGRATPAAAIETFCWALGTGDLDLVASFLTFSEDSPEDRAAFMANFSPAVRERYRTPERLCAAAFFGAGTPNPQPEMQVVSVQERDGPDDVRIKLWWRTPDGKEAGGDNSYRRRADGWAEKPMSLAKPGLVEIVRQRIDANGNFIRPATAKP